MYWVDTTISWTCVVGLPKVTHDRRLGAHVRRARRRPASRPVKLVTITVRDGSTSPAKLLFTRKRDLRLLDKLTTHST